MSKPYRRQIKASDLNIVARATYEEICLGDFVRLASGGPVGIVKAVGVEKDEVCWLTSPPQYSIISWVCLRIAASLKV